MDWHLFIREGFGLAIPSLCGYNISAGMSSTLLIYFNFQSTAHLSLSFVGTGASLQWWVGENYCTGNVAQSMNYMAGIQGFGRWGYWKFHPEEKTERTEKPREGSQFLGNSGSWKKNWEYHIVDNTFRIDQVSMCSSKFPRVSCS